MDNRVYVNKRGIKTKVDFREIPCTRNVAFYRCPSCYTYHEDGTLNSKVIRFRCSSCGQEIIIT